MRLSLARINWRWSQQDGESKGEWRNDRSGRGWIVPIPVGYGALSELHPPGRVANARDPATPFRFVESLYSVGEWISPHRLTDARQILWYPDCDVESSLYRCCNDYVFSDDDFPFVPDFELS